MRSGGEYALRATSASNLEDAQKEVLDSDRVDVTADRERCTRAIGPGPEVQERRLQLLKLLE